jgi:hypothetical protein
MPHHRIGIFFHSRLQPGLPSTIPQSHMKCRGHSRPAASRVKLRSADPRLQETDPNRDACGVRCFCSAQETMKLLPSCDSIGGICGIQAFRGLPSCFHHPPRLGRTADEEFPGRIRNQVAELELKLRERGRLNCLRPLNLIAPPQTNNCRGISLSGFSAAPPSIIRLGALFA